MPKMNACQLCGHATKDAEFTHTTGGTAKLSFTIGVDRGKKKGGESYGTDYVQIVVWGKSAEMWSQWGIYKGDAILVEGTLRVDNVQKEGAWKTYVNVYASKIQNLTSWARKKFGGDEMGGGSGADIPDGVPCEDSQEEVEIPF